MRSRLHALYSFGETPYGSTTEPREFGSGGSQGVYYLGLGMDGGAGGAGGGRIHINASGVIDMPVSAWISADGGRGVAKNPTQGMAVAREPMRFICSHLTMVAGGGGSGGSINMYARTVTGNGLVSADGGGHSSYSPGVGGGGRIALHTTDRVGVVVEGALHTAACSRSVCPLVHSDSPSAELASVWRLTELLPCRGWYHLH